MSENNKVNRITVGTIIAAVVIIGSLVAGVFVMEDRYMHAADAASKTDLSLTQKTANQALFKSDYLQLQFIIESKQQRLDKLQAKFGCPPRPDCPPEVVEEIARLNREFFKAALFSE